jgi:hypothetical protein
MRNKGKLRSPAEIAGMTAPAIPARTPSSSDSPPPPGSTRGTARLAGSTCAPPPTE